MVLVIAQQIEYIERDGALTFKRAAIIIGSFLLPLGLVFLQKDIGQAMVFIFVFMVTLFVGGINKWFLLSLIGAGMLALPFVWKFGMNDARRGRLLSFIDPEKYLDYSYQLRRTVTAIGSGQLTGEGLGNGTMNNGKMIPVKMSDSIFAVIGGGNGLYRLRVCHSADDYFACQNDPHFFPGSRNLWKMCRCRYFCDVRV